MEKISMATNTEVPFYLEKNEAINNCVEKDEFLHPEINGKQPAYDVVETQFFSVNIPEHDIQGVFYTIHHPHLNLVSGGVWICQGIKPLAICSDIFDMRDYMSDTVLKDDLHKYRLDNGYGVEVIKPLDKLHVTYDDPIRENTVDLFYSAVTPPLMFDNSLHFEQGMRAEGEIIIAGKKYPVDSYNVRDRSWGKRRPEHHVNVPPLYWTNCNFGDDFVFNCVSFDCPSLDPDWKRMGMFDEFTEENRFLSGWIFKNGNLRKLIDVKKITTHNPRTLFPERVEIEITDSEMEKHKLIGEIRAASRWECWPNFNTVVCLTKWECNGRIGYGDTQMYLHHDYIKDPRVYSKMLS
ncbi:MAG: hypothetical protein ACI9VI_001560 [Candidatus Azotimanducaceae bacterium]|jgi:hypothetical protein